MNNEKIKAAKKFNMRAFISSGMIISVIGLPLSGLMNHYFAFDNMTIERHEWMSAHNILGLFFTVFLILHIIYNRKLLTGYLRNFSKLFISKEALVASLIVIFFLVLVLSHVYFV
ncbi:MAG: DUF4405 domain-containing protein [Bacteroidetes bacterium]|nr:MAG: DUF4405 domain-containing protein [Bacteroidota bacterium]